MKFYGILFEFIPLNVFPFQKSKAVVQRQSTRLMITRPGVRTLSNARWKWCQSHARILSYTHYRKNNKIIIKYRQPNGAHQKVFFNRYYKQITEEWIFFPFKCLFFERIIETHTHLNSKNISDLIFETGMNPFELKIT